LSCDMVFGFAGWGGISSSFLGYSCAHVRRRGPGAGLSGKQKPPARAQEVSGEHP
jgi:hypothetical protein